MKVATNRIDFGAEGLELEVNALEAQISRARAYLRGLPPGGRRALGARLRILERELEAQMENQARRTGRQ